MIFAKNFLNGKYSKFLVSVLGAVSTGFETFDHASPLTTTVTGAIAAIVVWLVPNTNAL